MNLALDRRRHAFAAALDPVTDLPETCVEADRKCILPGNLHSVVFCRIVRSRDLHRSLEAIVCSTEIHHRGRAETYVIYICSGICESFEKVFVNLRRRDSGVSADKHLVCRKKFRKEETHLVGCLLVEIHVVDSPDVVCVECAHNLSF